MPDYYEKAFSASSITIIVNKDDREFRKPFFMWVPYNPNIIKVYIYKCSSRRGEWRNRYFVDKSQQQFSSSLINHFIPTHTLLKVLLFQTNQKSNVFLSFFFQKTHGFIFYNNLQNYLSYLRNSERLLFTIFKFGLENYRLTIFCVWNFFFFFAPFCWLTELFGNISGQVESENAWRW